MDLAKRVDAVREALWRCCCEGDGGMVMGGFEICCIEESFAVVRMGLGFWQISYTVDDAGMVMVADRASWQQVEQEWTPTMTIKSLGGDRIAGYVVLFGDAEHTDLFGDYFTPATKFWLDEWSERPMLYDHTIGLPADFDPVVGTWKSMRIDDRGVWGEGELRKSHAYRRKVKALIGDEVLCSSSDSAPHLVRKTTKGAAKEITQWPILGASLTPTPAEHRLQPLAAIKSAYIALGLPVPSGIDDTDPAVSGDPSSAESIGAPAQDDAATKHAALTTRLASLEETPTMNLKETIAAAKAALADGNAAEAERLTVQAEAIKRLDALEAEPPPAAKSATPVRPPFDAPDPGETNSMEQTAIKMFAVKRYGDTAAGCDQIAKELYGSTYSEAAFYKHRDFRRYIRTGQSDPAYTKMLLLTPDQIVAAYADGQSVSEIKSTMNEAVGELGGFLVPEDYRLELIERLPGLTVVRAGANVQSTQSNLWERPRVTGGDDRYIGNVRVTWVDESPTAGTAATNPTYGKISVPIHTVMGETFLTRSLLEDAGAAVADELIREMQTAFAIDEDAQFLTGSGVGKPQGILNGTAASGAPFDTDIQTVNSGHASTLLPDGLIDVPYKLAAQYRQAGAVWLMNKTAVGAIRKFKGTDVYFWGDKTNPLAAGQPERLLGYGLRESEAMPAIAANKYPIIFGDLKGYTIVDRVGLSIERYLDSATARQDQVLFIGRRRLGGKVTDGRRFIVQKVSA